VLSVISVVGLRRTLMLSTLLVAVQYPALALVDGLGPALLFYCALAALGDTFYYTCYHAAVAALGDAEHRGSQLGMTQGLVTLVNVMSPALGGLALATYGPWAAFGVGGLIEVAAVLPLRNVAEVPIAPARLRDVVAAEQPGALLFLTDSWITTCVAVAWDVTVFRVLGGRYDAFGGTLAAAALCGALGGVVLGRLIDINRARHAGWINAGVCGVSVILRAACPETTPAVVLTASLAAVLGALYSPSLMTAVYNDGKRADCPLRFQFVAEGYWDVGSALACLAAAVICVAGLPLQAVILLALPVVAVQAAMLNTRYEAHGAAGIELGR